MGRILRKWKWLIVAGLSLVFLAYIIAPVGSFVVETILRFRASSANSVSIPHWRTYTNSACGFIADFPSRPFEHPYELTNPAVISYRQFVAVLGDGQCFMVSTLLTSLTNDFTEEQINYLLDNAVLSGLKPNDKILAKRDLKLGANMGKEIEFQRGNQYHVRMRCYRVGPNKLQELTAFEPLARQYSSNIDHFFDSFRLISQ